MATGAISRKVCLTRFGIAGVYILRFIFHAVHCGLAARKQKSGYIFNLILTECKLGHALFLPPVENYGADLSSGTFIVQH